MRVLTRGSLSLLACTILPLTATAQHRALPVQASPQAQQQAHRGGAGHDAAASPARQQARADLAKTHDEVRRAREALHAARGERQHAIAGYRATLSPEQQARMDERIAARKAGREARRDHRQEERAPVRVP